MKIPGIAMLRKTKFFQAGRSRGWFLSIFLLMFIFLFAGVAFGSGGEAKGWVMTDNYRVMNFLVLAVGLFLIVRKPVAQALSDRIKGIKDQLSELEAKEKSAEKELAEYNKKLLMLDLESEKIVAEYINQGNDAKERILKEAETAAEKLEDQAKRNIEHAFKQAKLQLQEEIVEKALEKAEGIIKTEITFEDQDRLVDEYLEKVVA